MWLLYNVIIHVAVLLVIPIFLLRMAREKGFARRWRQSLGFLPAVAVDAVAGRGCVWVHAASVGEIVAASPIVREIRRQMPERPILVSVVTTAGYEMANRIMVEADAVIHSPLDLPSVNSRIITQISPAAFVLVETELWPNIIRILSRQSVPIIMVNGRISDRSVKSYGYLGVVLRDVLDSISLFCMQSEQDAHHIRLLGAEPKRVIVTGNTKFDQNYSEVTSEERQKLYGKLRLDNMAPVIVAGSTHPGEEIILSEAFELVREKFPNVQLVLAPRQILRASEVEALFKSAWQTVRRTNLVDYAGGKPDVIILDTIGELGSVYSIGDIIFVGGSLIPQGGHNVLEPAGHAKPILVGPHMFNFKDSYALLSQREACLTVKNAEEMSAVIISLLNDNSKARKMGENALAVIKENQGASSRSAACIKQIVMSQKQSNAAEYTQQSRE